MARVDGGPKCPINRSAGQFDASMTPSRNLSAYRSASCCASPGDVQAAREMNKCIEIADFCRRVGWDDKGPYCDELETNLNCGLFFQTSKKPKSSDY